MNMNDAISEYTTLLNDIAALAKYNLDCDTARDDALFDQLHGDEVKRPTQAAKDNEPQMPRVDMNIELALLCAVGGEHDPFKENWRRLPKRMREASKRWHEEFVAACVSGDWRKVWERAELMADGLIEMATADEQKDADRKLIEETHEGIMYLVNEKKRESKKARRTGRVNHRKGTK